MPETELAEVRARLERMVALAEDAQPDEWCGPDRERPWADRIDITGHPEDGPDAGALFIAAASPDLLFRLAREALVILDLHLDIECQAHCAYPCPEVASVLRAWQP